MAAASRYGCAGRPASCGGPAAAGSMSRMRTTVRVSLSGSGSSASASSRPPGLADRAPGPISRTEPLRVSIAYIESPPSDAFDAGPAA